jgi:hypothetical protein
VFACVYKCSLLANTSFRILLDSSFIVYVNGFHKIEYVCKVFNGMKKLKSQKYVGFFL